VLQERHRREAAAIQEQQRREAAERAHQRALVAAQDAAELSPDNICRKTEVAGVLLDEYNRMSWPPYQNRRVIDIEHLVTISRGEDGEMRCHGIWVHTSGLRIEGTMSFRQNVAGRMIVGWVAEEWQPPVLAMTPPAGPPSVR
jgi:hypothetical protein